MIKQTILALASGCILIAAPAHAADPAAGKTKAESCVECHGSDGKGEPPIAGMPSVIISIALKGYRSGSRTNEKMAKVASSLSDEDIANLAAYYSSLKK